MSTSAFKPVPVGFSDFREIRRRGLEYVDKTALIQHLLDDRGIKAMVFPRPRRFGKTLNLSTLRYFFEKSDEDRAYLFEGTAIWEAGEPYRSHFQRYPTIYLTFKDLHPSNLDEWRSEIAFFFQQLLMQYRSLLQDNTLKPWEKKEFMAVLEKRADIATLQQVLKDLSAWLHRRHGEPVVILIDEYDTPIHDAELGGFGKEVFGFIDTLLGAALKDNPHFFKGVITGILRVVGDSFFSGLDDFTAYDILQKPYSTCFGFTEAEVDSLFRRAGLEDRIEEARTWYKGYNFGGNVIYNPWSIVNYVSDPDGRRRDYWLDTSSNGLVRDLLIRHALTVDADIRALIDGGEIHKRISGNVVLSKASEDPHAMWNLFLFTGYLNARRLPLDDLDIISRYALSIPNREVRLVYTRTFRRWMEIFFRHQSGGTEAFIRDLFNGDTWALEWKLEQFAASISSEYDRFKGDPALIPTGLVLGLFVVLHGTHRVVSNWELGRHRLNVSIIPREPGRPGVVMALMIDCPEQRPLEEVLTQAVKRLDEQDDEAALVQAGAEPIHVYAVGFADEEVRVVKA